MSSHHIIREKQEPALLVLGLDNFTDELLGQLLEWSPTLLVTPLIAEKLNAYGIKIDWIIADTPDDALQSDIKYLPVGDSIIASAFAYLIAQGYPAVNIVTDDFNADDYLPFAGKINLVIFYDQQKIYTVSAGFNKWKPAGEQIKILSDPEGLHTDGLVKTGPNTFETLTDGFFGLQFADPFVLIAESL